MNEAGSGRSRVRPGPASCLSSGSPPIEDLGVGTTSDDVTCAGCGRVGTATDVTLGWSFDVPPRPTGSTEPARSDEASYLCPECTRRMVRDVEARLDL